MLSDIPHHLQLMRTEIYWIQLNAITYWVILSLGSETRLVILNLFGFMALTAFTGLVYLRTQEPLILLVGGLIAVVSVIGTTMRKS